MSPAKLSQSIEAFYGAHPEMNMSMALVFLFVAMRGVCTQRDVQAGLRMKHSTASRNVSWWCAEKKYGRVGIGYLERCEDPTDRRYKLVRLTEKGQKFYARLTRDQRGAQ